MLKRREDKVKTIIITILIVIAWMCRFPYFNISTIHYLGAACGLLRPLIYIGICVAWSVSVSRTIINKRLRHFLKMIALCCILWMFLRTVKYELTCRGDIVNIVLMYAYYIPFILLPTFGFFASLYARRGELYHIPRKVYIVISFVSALALIVVFTNPFHKLYWLQTTNDDLHGSGYLVVIGWIVLLSAVGIINIIIRTKIPGKPAAPALPLAVIGIIIGYFVMYAFFTDIWKFISSDWTSFVCLAVIGLMQSCISSGMLPSNRDYAKIFEAADDGAVITDEDWNICYASAGAEIFPKEILQKTETGVFEKDKNTLLKGRKLHPGHVVWQEDISAITAILDELEKNRKELTVKNELDSESNRTELALAKVKEKNRLYDLSQAATQEQNKLLRDTLSRYFDESDADTKEKLLVRAAVLGAYIKRKGNLIFAGDGGKIKASELKLCFNESLSHMELLQTDCQMEFSVPDETVLSLKNALFLYDSFEKAVEDLLVDISAAFVRIMEDDAKIQAIYSLVSAENLSIARFPKEVSVERDDDTWIVSMTISKGGGA